jgi:hypothetical protein
MAALKTIIVRKIISLSVLLLITGFSGCFFLYSSPGPGLCTASLQPTADAFVAENNPTVNYGLEASLIVSPGLKRMQRSLVMFDLVQIPPGSKLAGAQLKLYVARTEYAVGRGTYECYLLDRSWAERTVNWNNQPGSVSGSAVYSTVPATGSWMTWNVASSVGLILAGTRSNFGWGIRDRAEGMRGEIVPSTAFASRENPVHKPTLEVSFYPPKLTISGPTSAYVETWVKLTVERRDADNLPITRGDLRVQLSSSSASARFALSEGGSQATELTIPNGVSKKDFYYYDTRVGSATITADTNQYRDDYYEAGRFSITLETRDVEGPKVTIRAIPEKAKDNEKISVIVDASDPSGIKTVKVLQRGVAVSGSSSEQSLFMQAYEGSFPASFHKEMESGPFPGMRVVEFEAEATDKYGNIGRNMVSVIIVTPPPKRTCGCRISYAMSMKDVEVFTHWDSMAAGDVVGDERDEVIVAQDDGGGRLYVYTWNSGKDALEPLESGGQVFFKVRYTKYDRLAVGNVMGDEKDEILIAVDDDGKAGMIYIYQLKRTADGYELECVETIDLDKLGCKFASYDAFFVGNVFNDDAYKEIVLAKDDDERIYVIDHVTGNTFSGYVFFAGIRFAGFRYTGGDDDHDEIAAANIVGDETDEIVYASNDKDMLYVFSLPSLHEGTSWMRVIRQFHIEFTGQDAMCVGDVLGDSRPEILIFRDDDRIVLIYDFFLEPVKLQYIFYSPYDGVATGDLVGLGKKQIIVATDDENDIRLAYSEELWEG